MGDQAVARTAAPDPHGERHPATVVFVHGLWMRGPTLSLQARRIGRCGLHTDCGFSYTSVSGTLDLHARRLARYVAGVDAPRVHLVGHSMGTLVILKMLSEFHDSRLGRAVLLGPPFHGSRAGRAVGGLRPGRWMLGRSYALWSQEEAVPPPCDVDVGVIAGTMPLGVGALLRVLESPHDGIVTCRETLVPGARDHIRLRVSHAGMLVAPSVARQILAFLEGGRFQRPEAEVV